MDSGWIVHPPGGFLGLVYFRMCPASGLISTLLFQTFSSPNSWIINFLTKKRILDILPSFCCVFHRLVLSSTSTIDMTCFFSSMVIILMKRVFNERG